jgi:hypothetical protein
VAGKMTLLKTIGSVQSPVFSQGNSWKLKSTLLQKENKHVSRILFHSLINDGTSKMVKLLLTRLKEMEFM